MDTGVARQPFEAFRHLDHGGDLLVVGDERAQFVGGADGFVEGDAELARDELGDLVDDRKRHVHHAADIAHGALGEHAVEGDDLGDVIGAVFARDVVDDLAAPLVAKIDVDIGHAHALRVEEALEEQLILEGIDVGDAEEIADDAAGCRAAARADEDAVAFGVVDKIPDDEEIGIVAHFVDDAELVVEPLCHLGAGSWIAAVDAFFTEAAQIGLVVHARRRVEIRHIIVPEGEIEIAFFGDAHGFVEGGGVVGQHAQHFFVAFEIKLVAFKAHAILGIKGCRCLDAEHHILHGGVFSADIVVVVGGDEAHAELPGKLVQAVVDLDLAGNTVVLQLEIIILAKEVLIPHGGLARALEIVIEQQTRHFATKAGAHGDEAIVIVCEQLAVDTRMIIKAFERAQRHELAEIAIAGVVFHEQDEMVRRGVEPAFLVKARARRDIHLAADDGLDTSLFAGAIKLHGAVHDAVVGDGKGGHAKLDGAVDLVRNAAGAVEQAVSCVVVQVYEWFHRLILCQPSRIKRSTSLCATRRPSMVSMRTEAWWWPLYSESSGSR